MSKARKREASYADTATVQQSMMKMYRLDGGKTFGKNQKNSKNKQTKKMYSLNKYF